MKIEVSIGEVFDKITILEIKKKKITDGKKLENINYEIENLYDAIRVDGIIIEENLFKSLMEVNERLWEIEDVLREKEKNKCYDEEFIRCAESDSVLNDERFLIKNKINVFYNSQIKEHKSYEHLKY